MATPSIILTCEHAGNQVPVRYRSLFENNTEIDSHKAWDAGALDMAVALSEELNLSLFAHQTTRLLVDVNHSLLHAKLFSPLSLPLGDEDKQLLLDKYYFPFRLRVENAIALTQKPVIHFSIHSFPPAVKEVIRLTDVGILFDTHREQEKVIGEKILTHLKVKLPALRGDSNMPYTGVEDSFTTYLRTRFTDEEYIGVVLTVNQKHTGSEVSEKITIALREVLSELHS